MDLTVKVVLSAEPELMQAIDGLGTILAAALSVKAEPEQAQCRQSVINFDAPPVDVEKPAVAEKPRKKKDEPKAEAKEEPKAEAKEEPKAEVSKPEKDLRSEAPSIVEVRAVAAEKARAGKRKEANEIVLSYGVSSITELMETSAEDILDCFTRLKEL